MTSRTRVIIALVLLIWLGPDDRTRLYVFTRRTWKRFDPTLEFQHRAQPRPPTLAIQWRGNTAQRDLANRAALSKGR